MQHDHEQHVAGVSLQSIGEVDQENLRQGEEHLLNEADLQAKQRRKKPSPTLWRLVLIIGDGSVLLISLGLLLLVVPLFHTGFHFVWDEPRTWELKLVWGCIALLSWSVAASIVQAQDLRSVSNRLKSTLRAVSALVLMVIIWLVITYPFIADRIAFSVALMLLFLLLATPLLSIWRVAIAEIMHLPRFRTQGVIIGITAAGEALVSEFMRLKRTSMNLLGYINESAHENLQEHSLPVLGGRNTLHSLIHNGMLDMMVLALDYNEDPILFKEAIEATQLGVSLVPMPVAYERISGKIPVEYVGDQWYLALPVERGASPIYLCWRKFLDITFGLFGLLILILILPVMALLIRLDSPGPVFYKQERLGLHGRKFSIYKFRSMHSDAERVEHAVWATTDDMRITRIGRFMRATHLDELPQAFNIVRGDMSLIGPRPEREVFVSELVKTIPFYRCRLMVKPGLTGWAQVKFPYGGTSLGALAKLQYDLYYVKHQSFTLDIWIIFKTISEVLSGRGT